MRSISLAALLFVASCASDSDNAELDSARDSWSTEGLSAYSFQWRAGCGECEASFTRPILVTVAGGVITSAIDAETEEPVSDPVRASLRTIDGLFELVQDATDRDAHVLAVDYDPTLGYPASISIDYREDVADDEWGVTITSFATITTR